MNKEKRVIILDGAMGTMLQKSGLKLGERPEVLSIKEPQIIENIHREYILAGAEIIYANTFGANDLKLEGTGFSLEEVIAASIKCAKNAAQNTNVKIALDMGPLGELLEPNGKLTFDRAYECFKHMAEVGEKCGADIAVVETMTDLYEVKAAVLAIKENTKLPIMVSMTFEENGRTFTGCSIEAMAALLEGLGVDSIGINCSLGPDEINPLAKKLCESTSLPVFIKPNAGLPDPETGKYFISPKEFAKSVSKYLAYGVTIIGGCCGTTPEYIREIKTAIEGLEIADRKYKKSCVVSTATKVVKIDDVKVIGERINPTGKKLMREALQNNDMGYILNQAISQKEAGADILDVNVGAPGINEKEVLPFVIRELQKITDLPLQLDSSDGEALENGLRIYNGKAIVNSVNGNDEVLDTILPIVKKYGACVVGLTLDEDGIPETVEKRVQIAEKIIERAKRVGIPKEDVIIDCLTLTASAQQEGAMQTLEALKQVKEKFGVKTVLGVSNISFGLPNRELLNHSFLLMALHSGLDLPIINPNIDSMMDAIRAFRVLSNRDKQSYDYIDKYKDYQKTQNKVVNVVVKKSLDSEPNEHPVISAIKKGLHEEVRTLTCELLKNEEPMSVVNNYLIPALDKVGELFEKGKFFLPQLLQAATSAQGAFEEVKKVLDASSDKKQVKKGPIVIATVEGDIHDIGKNIVKVILENYGFDVIDLGRDVSKELVIETVKKTGAKLVGLSALMTTTLKSMEETIKAIHKENLPCKIMVGGAVLTPEYAVTIGADYYSKDAKQAADIAKLVFD